MGHSRALVTIRTVGGSMVYINNNQLASEFLQLLSGDGQTIDNDIQRRADTVTTSLQLQKSIGNILGRPFHSFGTALFAARQVQKASNSDKHVWTPSTAQDQYSSTSLSSEDGPVSGAKRVQQQNVEHVLHQHIDVPVPQVCKQKFEVETLSEQGSATTCSKIDEIKCVPVPHVVDQIVDVSVPQVDEQEISTQDQHLQ